MRAGLHRVVNLELTACAQGADALAALVTQAAGRIAVMAGGGVRPNNAAALLRRTGVRELHTSARRFGRAALPWGEAAGPHRLFFDWLALDGARPSVWSPL